MPDRRAELLGLTTRFVDAFNRQDLDDVMSYFAEDALYEDSRGGSHRGLDSIRAAFTPLLNGGAGRIRFDDEDFFAEANSDKVLASWVLHMNLDGDTSRMRGLDVLHFRGDKLVRKLAYCKAKTPALEN